VKSNAWEAIVPEPMWKAVVGVLDDPSRVKAPTGGRAVKYLGSCLFVCWCGATVRPSARKGRRPTYICGRFNSLDDHATLTVDGHIRRNVADVDGYVRDVILERLSRNDVATLLAKPGEEIDVAALSAERLTLLQTKRDLALLFNRADDRAALIAAKADADARLDEIDAALKASSRISAVGRLIDADDPRALWDERMSLGERRVVIGELATVEIWPTERGQRRFDPSAVRVIFKAEADA
jgi:hypothetical protein